MGKKDRKKKTQQVTQQEISPPENGISTEKQNVSAENLNTEKEKLNEQTILPETRTPKSNSNDKKSKKEKKSKGSVKLKKAGFFSLFSIRRLILFYILAVFFWCNGKTQKQCNSYEESLCFNGISQYILNNDFFHKYIEPAIIVVKQNVDVYGKQALNTVSIHYKTHAKPYVGPFLESAQPHLQSAKEFSVEYVYNPATEGLTKAQEYYNDNAKEHVDNCYNQAVKLSAPYVSQAQERVFYVYEQASEFNKNTVQPWYYKSVVPFKDKVIFHYNTKIEPFAYHTLEIIIKTYREKIVPAYHNHVKPYFSDDKSKTEKETKAEAEKKAKEEADKKAKAEAERKAKEEADKKAKAEAERRAKEEADKKAKAEAERKAKEEADKKAKAEAEKKAKEEADKKAKAEAEKKAKEEADKKAKAEEERKAKEEADKKAKAEAERKAKEEADKMAKAEAERRAKEEADKAKAAIEAANKAVRDAIDKEFPLVKNNITLALDDYERKATSMAREILHEAEDKLKKIRSEYLLNLKKFVEKIKKDSTKDRNTKFNEIKDLAKKYIDNIKEFIEISEKSFEEKLDKLKEDFDLNFVSQVYATKVNIYDQANNKTIDDKLKQEIEIIVNNIVQESFENKNSASLRVRDIMSLLKSAKDDVIKDIHSYVKTEKEILKSEANEKIPKKDENDDNKNTDALKSDSVQDTHKDNNQIPIQVKEKLTAGEKASDITFTASSDLVLKKLKARQDPVLDILKRGYELFKAEKGNEQTKQVQSVDNEDEDDEESECSDDQ